MAEKTKFPYYKKNYIVAACLVLVLIMVGILFLQIKTNIDKQTKRTGSGYTEGQGGDPKSVQNDYSKALKAWDSGDKETAKQLAQKAINENANLTTKQRQQIPGQVEVIANLYNIKQGRAPVR